jgi:hypothetical protein
MASGNNSGTGDLDILIGGDISPLDDALSGISESAQAAASAVNAALGSTDGADALTTSATAAAGAISGIAPAAQAAGSAVAGVDTAITTTTGDTEGLTAAISSLGQRLDAINNQLTTANSSLADIADSEQRVAESSQESAGALEKVSGALETVKSVAEALAAVALAETLREFATAAIEAYGEAQRVETSLRLMSGSAESASEIMEHLDEMSTKLGIPLANLEAAAQRASTVLGTGDGLTAALNAAANASAATGGSFDSVVNALDRIQTTGAVTGRQLMALGLQWQDLATTMGVSIDEAQARLKRGGQDAVQDVQAVVDAIEQKYGDAAAQQAQGILSQIQQLKNAATLVMQQIGEAIAPAVTSIVTALKTTVIPAIQAAVDAFKALPPGIQDVIVIGGALATALVPVAAGLATLGFAISGVETLLGALGVSFGQTAVAAGTFAAAETAATAATEGLGAAAGTVGTGLLSGIGAAIASIAAVALPSLGAAVLATRDQLDALKASAANFDATLKGATNTAINHTAALKDMESGVKAAMAAYNSGITIIGQYSGATKDFVEKQQALVQAEKDAKQTLLDVTAAHNAGLAPLSLVTAATIALQKAHEAANPAIKATTLSFADLAANAVITQQNVEESRKTFLQTEAAFISGFSSLAAYDAAWNQYSKDAKAAGVVATDVTHAIISQTQSANESIQKLTGLIDTFETLDNIENKNLQQSVATSASWKAAQEQASKLGLTLVDAGDHLQVDFTDKATKAGTTTDALRKYIESLYGQTDAYTVLVNGKVMPVLQSLSDGLAKNIIQAGGFSSAMENVTDKAGKAAGQIEVLRGSTEAYQTASDAASASIMTATGKVESQAEAVKAVNDAWLAAAKAQGSYLEVTNAGAGEIDDETGAIQTQTESIGGQINAVNELARAWDLELAASESAAAGPSKSSSAKGAGGVSVSQQNVLSMYAMAGATGGQLDALAQAMGLVVVGQNQYATQDYINSLKQPGGNPNGTTISSGVTIQKGYFTPTTGSTSSSSTSTATAATPVSTSTATATTAAAGATNAALSSLVATEQQYQQTLSDTIAAYQTGNETLADVQAALANYQAAMDQVQAAVDETAATTQSLSQATGSQTTAADTLATTTAATAATVTEAAMSIGDALTGTAQAATAAAAAVNTTTAALAGMTMEGSFGSGTTATAMAPDVATSVTAGLATGPASTYGLVPASGQVMSGLTSVVGSDLSASSQTPTAQVTVNVSAGTVVGANGMQQLSQMVGNQIVTQLRQVTGLKIP